MTRKKEAQGAGRGRAACIVGVDAVGTEGWLRVLGRASCVGGADGLPEGGEGTFRERQGDARRCRSGAGKTGIRKNKNQHQNRKTRKQENEKTRKAEGRKETYTHVPHYCWLLVFQQSKTREGRTKKKRPKKKTKKTEEKAKTEKTEIREWKLENWDNENAGGVWGVECGM